MWLRIVKILREEKRFLEKEQEKNNPEKQILSLA